MSPSNGVGCCLSPLPQCSVREPSIHLLYLLFCPRLHPVTYCHYNRFHTAFHIDRAMGGGEKMHTVWTQRREEVVNDCLVSPDIFHHMVDRLAEFVVPYQHV